MSEVITDKDTNSYIFPCPHCQVLIQVLRDQVNCKIFRHAYYKDSLRQIDPHTPKDLCDRLVKEGRVYGCAKPFQLVFQGETVRVEKCGYI